MGIPVHASKSHLRGELIHQFGADQDAVHVGGGCVEKCFIKPTANIPLNAAHFDGFQLIKTHPFRSNIQYALAYMSSVRVTGNVVDGETTPIQCVFASDGVFGYANVSHNILRTDGHHLITINGLLEGDMFDNEFISPAEYPMKFLPARVGGNATGKHNVWLVGFKDNYYEYKDIRTDRPDLVQDLRQVVFNQHDSFLTEFDVPKFESLAAQVSNGSGAVMGQAFQEIALLCGTITNEVIKIPDREIFTYE